MGTVPVDKHLVADLRRRRLLKASLAATGVALAGGGYLAVRKLGSDAASMVLQLGWLPGPSQIGEIVAKRRGFYKQEGIAFRLSSGGPSVDGVSVVASGSAQAGQISSSPSIMLAVSQNIPIRCFATALQRHPFSFYSLPGNPVRSVAAMVGKKVGVPATAAVLVRAAVAEAHLPASSVQIVPVGADLNPLLTGQVDVITGWSTNTTALRVLGPDRVELSLWATGIHLYALPYYAALHTLDSNFDSVVRFLRATARGWAYARDHTDEAAELLVQEYPNLNKDEQRLEIAGMLAFAFADRAKELGWGTMDAGMWEAQIDVFKELGQFTNRVPSVADVMTLDALNATQAYRMRL